MAHNYNLKKSLGKIFSQPNINKRHMPDTVLTFLSASMKIRNASAGRGSPLGQCGTLTKVYNENTWFIISFFVKGI